MRPSYFLVCALLSPAAIGCSDSLPPPPVVEDPTPTPVHIRSGITPLLVAYRDGFTDSTTLQPVPWKTATAPDLKSVDLMVKGAYSVAVVCMVDGNTVLTWQAFHTVDDDTTKAMPEPTLQTPCNAAPPAHFAIKGTLTHAGFAHLGDAETALTAAGGPFNLQVTAGTFDFVAAQTDAADPAMNKILITRNVMVTAADDRGPVDASTGGAAMAPITPGLDNAPPAPDPDHPKANTEVVTAEVTIQTKNNDTPAFVSSATFNLDKTVNKAKTVTAFGVADAGLVAGDAQFITFTGTNNIDGSTISTTRSITKPFKAGDDTATGKPGAGSSLPSLLATANVSPGWDFDKNRLGVALPALPALDDLTITTSGFGPTSNVRYEINITASYFQTTALARPVFDTDIPSFQAGWKIDFNREYTREIKTEHDVFSKGVFIDHEESSSKETLNSPPAR
jgi:hypothetical protein